MLVNKTDGGVVILSCYHCTKCHSSISLEKDDQGKYRVPDKCGRCDKHFPTRFANSFDPITATCETCKMIWDLAKSLPGGTESITARLPGRPTKEEMKRK